MTTSMTTRFVKRRDVKVKANRLKKKVKIAGEKWTVNEKNSLYKALCKYGEIDIDKIVLSIRTRSVNDVKWKIKHYETVARAELQELISLSNGLYRNIESCDKWIYMIRHLNKTPRPGRTMAIGLVFKMLELFDNHPNPKTFFGINMKEIYGWLFDCHSGNATRKLDIKTTAFVLKVLQNLPCMYRKDFDVSHLYLPSIIRTKKPIEKKTFKRKRQKSNENSNNKNKPIIITYSKGDIKQLEIFTKLLEDQNMNPLNFLYYSLKDC